MHRNITTPISIPSTMKAHHTLPLLTILCLMTMHAVAQTIGGGNQHSVLLCAPGQLRSTGLAMFGQLGNGTTDATTTHVPVSMLDGVERISVYQHQTIALRNDGTVWTFGYQVGTTGTFDALPVQVAGLTNIIDVAIGFAHAVALRSDGTVWTWGDGLFGQLGNGQMGPGTVSLTPVQVSGLSNIISIAAGGYHTLALRNDNTVRAWGLNANGQLGDATLNNSAFPVNVIGPTATALAVGNNHSLMLRSDGSIWAWGHNAQGALGDGTTVDKATPVPSLANTGFVSVKAGVDHSMAIRDDGTAWAWGYNAYGRLGDGTWTNRLEPVAVLGLSDVLEVAGAAGHSLARTADGAIWVWGNNEFGQFGNGTLTSSLVPLQVDVECGDPSSTGITSERERTTWTIRPNPASDVFHITLTQGTPHTRIWLTDPTGRVVIAPRSVTGPHLELAVNGLPAGVYFVHLLFPDGYAESQRVVVQ